MSARNALITGASSGIGAACASHLLSEGWSVTGWDLQPGSDDRVTWEVVDVTDWEAIGRATESLPPLGALLNGAAIGSREALLDLSRDEWDRVLAIDLSAYFYVARWAFDRLHRGKGTVVNISSIAATNGFLNRAAYSCAKAGVLSLTRSMAIEWAPLGVRVFAVSPTFTRTPMIADPFKRGLTDENDVLKHTPQGRLLEADEVAGAIVRLLDDDFRSITGSNVLLDAGFDAFSAF